MVSTATHAGDAPHGPMRAGIGEDKYPAVFLLWVTRLVWVVWMVCVIPIPLSRRLIGVREESDKTDQKNIDARLCF